MRAGKELCNWVKDFNIFPAEREREASLLHFLRRIFSWEKFSFAALTPSLLTLLVHFFTEDCDYLARCSALSRHIESDSAANFY